MIKKIIPLILISSLVFVLIGCQSKNLNKVDDENKKNDDNSQNQEKEYDTYFCSTSTNSDKFYFYYINNNLEKVDYLKLIDEDNAYQQLQKKSSSYKNITVSKRSDNYILVEIVIKDGNEQFLIDNFSIFSSLNNTDWNNINAIVNKDYSCVNKGALDFHSNHYDIVN